MPLAQRLQDVQQRIANAATEAGRRAESVRLIAVSKRHPTSAIREAFQLGQWRFGENYVQEALDKQAQLADLAIEWHFIGPIQSNKTRAIAEHFAWVHSVDRLKIAERLSAQRPASLPPLNLCIQVNIDDESSKSGIAENETAALARAICPLPRLQLRGLMCIPAPGTSVQAFARMQRLFLALPQALNLPHWDTLSMGMSADLASAIAQGANMVRIGTDIFGERPPSGTP